MSRRLLLAMPRERSAEHGWHIARCRACARLARRLSGLERRIHDAAAVAVPAALADRVLFARRLVPVPSHAAAAALAISVVTAALFGAVDTSMSPKTVQAVGPAHPAVAAIAEVVQDESPGEAFSGVSADMQRGLKKLGLTLKTANGDAYYLGKCHVRDPAECEHIVLSTPEVHANVMLLPEYPIDDRVLVEDRKMVALVTPARSGGYIVIAKSPRDARRAEKLLGRSG
ncbi:MAG TPA: DUF3379 family protein [Burkholderiales bacterium]|nr:DUF3379 family protein [Burkholderiales bacterium]